MTQVEYEQRLKDLKREKTMAQIPLAGMIDELKEQIATKKQFAHELNKSIERLGIERRQLSRRVTDIINDYDKRIDDFRKKNFFTTRELENISDATLVVELNRRGYWGGLTNPEKDPDFMAMLNDKLNAEACEKV